MRGNGRGIWKLRPIPAAIRASAGARLRSLAPSRIVPASARSVPARKVEKGGLSGAVRPDDPEHFASGERQRHAVDDAQTSEGFLDPPRLQKRLATRHSHQSKVDRLSLIIYKSTVPA
jgi:hypothetical protein